VSQWLFLQGGLDECVRSPGGDAYLFVRCESSQILQDDQCLPSDNHRESGYEAFEPGVVEVVAQWLDRILGPAAIPDRG
jgi:hypothetical protein